MTRQHWLIAGMAVAALAGGLGLSSWLRQPGSLEVQAAQQLLAVSLRDLNDQPNTLNQFRGKVLVVNFWAAWCPPCRQEIPDFIEIQARLEPKGIQFTGIALDNPEKARHFFDEVGMNYPTYIANTEISEIMRSLGNKSIGLPYTLIYDREGQLREKIIGGIDKTRLEKLISPLI